MLVKCWGSRGSLPVSGPEHIKYGGDTTCIELRTKSNELLIIDAGSGIRALGNMLLDKITNINIIFTHAHWDHLIGFPFFKPLYKKGIKINFYGCSSAQKAITNFFHDSIEPPFLPITFKDIKATLNFNSMNNLEYEIGSLKVQAINLNHPNGGFGYKFIEGNKTFVFLTDNELSHHHKNGKSFDEYKDFATNSDFLIHDSEYTINEYSKTKGWGHSTYIDAIKLAHSANVKLFGLFHHNQDRCDKNNDSILDESQKILNKLNSNVKCISIQTGTEILL